MATLRCTGAVGRGEMPARRCQFVHFGWRTPCRGPPVRPCLGRIPGTSRELRNPYAAEARRRQMELAQIFELGREPARTINEEVGSAGQAALGLVQIAGEGVFARRLAGECATDSARR